MSFEANFEMLKLAAKFLEDLKEEVVFVGGATTCLYVDQAISDEIRPTDDVDCVIEITSRNDFDKFQAKLRKKGFTHDTSKGAPICRFKYGESLVLDVMPNDAKILGFSNSWYKEGIRAREKRDVGGEEIYIFSLPYFLASKFEAFMGRGSSEPRLSWDLEDIVLILDGIKDFEVTLLQNRLGEYLSKMGELCRATPQIQEAISGFLNHNVEKIKKINERLKLLSEIEENEK